MKKFLSLALVAIISVSLLCGCGKETTGEVKETVEENAATDVAENASEDEIAVETASEELDEQYEVEPEILWYMDEEGLKNDDMGVVIRKDNDKIQDLTLFISVFLTKGGDVGPTGDLSASQARLTCNYYDGTLDDYVNDEKNCVWVDDGNGGGSYEPMPKAQVGKIEYAYDHAPDSHTDTKFYIVQNGILFNLSCEVLDPVVFLEKLQNNNFLKQYEDTNEALAYLASDGLYIPAMGICFSVEDDQMDEILSKSVWCSRADQEYYGDSLSIQIDDYTMYYYSDAETALDVVDNFATEEPYNDEIEYSVIDDILERNIGNVTFTGRGRNDRSGFYLNDEFMLDDEADESWLFCSEDLRYVISFSYVQGDTLSSGEEVTPDYFLSFIEEY